MASAHIGFDFDGVIADSSEVVCLVVNHIASAKKVASLSLEEVQALAVPDLLAHFRMRWFEVFWWVRLARRLVFEHRHLLKLQPHIVPLLRWAQQHQVSTSILSSNGAVTIREFVDKFLPEQCFDPIVGGVSLFGKHRALRRLGRRLPGTIYIGDEVRDVQAAHRCKLPAVAVTWGKDSALTLRRSGADFVADNGEDLVACVTEHWLSLKNPARG